MSDKPEVKQGEIVTTQGTQIQYVGDRNIVKEMAYRLRFMLVGGKRLSDDECIAWAQYSVANDLNPMVGESVYIPGSGPGPGIPGWRKKATEQLRQEAQVAKYVNATWACEYVQATHDEAKFDENAGDIARKAILRDTVSHTAWEQRRLSYFIQMKNAGVNGEAWQMALELAGPEPVWSAVGVVRGTENFGANEKMDRIERACKRAEKAAIRKRFPLVNLVEPEGFDDGAAPQVVSFGVVDSEPEPEKPTRSEAQIMAELGY